MPELGADSRRRMEQVLEPEAERVRAQAAASPTASVPLHRAQTLQSRGRCHANFVGHGGGLDRSDRVHRDRVRMLARPEC